MEPIKGHICRSCRLRLSNPRLARSFSTSTTLRVVPPESPYYVDIPQSYQAFAPYKPEPKGSLPNPRELFPANRPNKSTPEYIEQVTPDPLPFKNTKPSSQISETAKYKARMTETRRAQLREGLAGLQARKKADLTAMSARSTSKQRQRAKLLTQAEREDARLTNISVPQTMKPQNTHRAIPIETLEAQVTLAKQIYETKRANYAAHVQAQEDMKMDALHTLYMNARNFVTSEAQMNKLLKDQFDNKKRFENDVSAGDSMWNLGAPDSIKDMILDATNKQKGRSQANSDILSSMSAGQRFASSVRAEAGRASKDQERLKKIAEKLSGGKI